MNFLNLITGETIMANSNFASIDPNQPATQRQVYGVACHFASIHAKSPSERYGLTKVFHAILNKYYSNKNSFMTHSDVSEWRSWTEQVPPVILSFISKPNAKALKKPKASKKVAAKKPTASKAKKSPAKPKATQGDRITALEGRVDAVDSKLDAILNILQK